MIKRKDQIQNDLIFLLNKTKKMEKPLTLKIIEEFGKDPFLILISCLLSLRSRDIVTYKVCKKLFKKAKTPEEILKIPISKLENIIYSTGFYKQKARTLYSVSREIINKFKGVVPSSENDLLSIKGVGRKTANLVLSEAFDVPAIAVDTHVHRLANQLRWVQTKTPKQTEDELKKIFPKNKWKEINRVLVTWGQNRKDLNLSS